MKDWYNSDSFWRYLLATSCLLISALVMFVGWTAWQQNEQSIEQALQEYDRFRGVVNYASQQTISKEELPQSSGLFLPSDSDAAVSANLQATVKSLAMAQAVEVIRSAEEPVFEENGAVWHPIVVDFAAPYSSLMNFVSSVEQQKPLLIIDKMQIQPNIPFGTQLQQDPFFNAEITISGATRGLRATDATVKSP